MQDPQAGVFDLAAVRPVVVGADYSLRIVVAAIAAVAEGTRRDTGTG